MTIEVRCEKCERRVRITRVREAEEFAAARSVRADYARVCPENRINGPLACPMADPSKEPEKAL